MPRTKTKFGERGRDFSYSSLPSDLLNITEWHQYFQETRSIWKMLGPFATASRFTLSFTRCRYYHHCRTPPAHRCPRRRRWRQQQRQRVTEGTAMAPWNGPNNSIKSVGLLFDRAVYTVYGAAASCVERCTELNCGASPTRTERGGGALLTSGCMGLTVTVSAELSQSRSCLSGSGTSSCEPQRLALRTRITPSTISDTTRPPHTNITTATPTPDNQPISAR